MIARALLACLVLVGAARAQEERPRSVLFLFADDQRPDAIAAFGHPDLVTPNLDSLVEDGASFRDTYCQGSFHGAVCQPSRAMLLSGRHLFRAPQDLEGVVTLPEWLGARGYATFATGKWHNGKASLRRSFRSLKHIMLGGMSDHSEVPLHEPDESGQLAPAGPGDRFSSELFADAAIEFLRDVGDRPFFAYVAFTAPHDPRMLPGDARAPYLPASKLALPENFMPQHPFDNGRLIVRDEALAPWPRTPEVVREQLADYYGMITHLDRQIGRILRALDEAGRANDTYVVFAADHGLAMGSHGLLGKQSVYEHSMGAPLVIRGPGIPAGAEYRAFAYLFDLFPTLCDLLGVERPDGLDGESLVPVLRGEKARVRERVFLAYEDAQRSVRDERYKLIRYPKVDCTQLFDLLEDPLELVDLSSRPEQAPRVEEMTAWLEEEQSRYGDTAPLSVAEPGPAAIDLSGRERRPDRWQPESVVARFFGPAAEDLAIADVNLVDVKGGEVLPRRTVWVRGGRIHAVGPTGEVEIPEGARVVNGAGRFLLPGLIVQGSAEGLRENARAPLVRGVTTVAVAAGSKWARRLADRCRRGVVDAPWVLDDPDASAPVALSWLDPDYLARAPREPDAILSMLRRLTCDAAGRLALPDRGAIEPGLRADLLLLDQDPTVDLENLVFVRAVCLGGRWFRVEPPRSWR